MKSKGMTVRFISMMLALSIVLSCVACSSKPAESTRFTLSSPDSKTIVENIETESIITEEILYEHITEEIYLNEMIVVEDKITELLLEEDMINEVILCKTVYVPEENIEDFAEHSQTAQLFGEGLDIKDVLKKVAIGKGIIVTLTIVKVVGRNSPIASVVAAAADASLKFSKSGEVVGTVFGAFTGAADEIDKSGRTSAVFGFALATVGLIVTALAFILEYPSAGVSSLGVAEGIHLAWAGIQVISSAAGTIATASNMIKTFQSTPASEIDWDNIDWDKVGVAAAQKAIQNGADGYMWGAIYGAIDGSVEGYYQKYCTPYTLYQNRLNQTPKDGPKGYWTGARGESDYVLAKPIELSDGTIISKIHYQNAVPDFSPYAIAEVKIPCMTNERYIKNGNFDQADEALAEYWTKIKYNDKKVWTSDDVKIFREEYPYKLTWHEMSNMETMQLVPYEVNDTFSHYGGVAEYNAMIGQVGGSDFD